MNRTIYSFITVLAGVMLAGSAQAFPVSQPVPGGVAILPLAPVQVPRPIVYYGGQRVTVVPQGKDWLAIVGVPLDAGAGMQTLELVNAPEDARQLNFAIGNKRYKTQSITLKDDNQVNPDDESSQRIVRELGIQEQLKTRFTEREAALDFIRPIAGRDSGRFGSRRILNGQPRSPHSGMDIAAAQGTPVKSTAAGQVMFTGNLFFSGNVVYVDHGSGVISMYAHLSRIKVKPGDWLDKGQVLGLVGKTGRATGPHLHWSVYLNGEAVNPGLFIHKSN